MKGIWLLSLIVVAGLTVTGCVNRKGQEQAKKVAAIVTDQSTPVEVFSVNASNVPKLLALTGQVVTDDDVEVSVKAPGRLSVVYVKEGSIVSAGQVIAIQEGREAQTRVSQALANQQAAASALRQAQRDATVAPDRTAAAVRASEARVRQAKAALLKAKNGSRSEEKAQAKSNVARTKSDLDLARKTLDRSIRLEKEGAISTAQLEIDQNRFDNAQSAYTSAVEQYNLILEATRPEDIDQAQEAVKQAEEQLKLDKANQKLDPSARDRVDSARAQLNAAQDAVRLAQIAVDDLTVRAPMSGKISGKPLQAGTLVSPGVAVARLIGTGGIFFEAEVPEKDIAEVVPGMTVESTVQALGDIVLTGKVVSISPLASNLGRLYSVRVSISEAAGKIKPGMFVHGELKLGTIKDVYVVANNVLIRDGEATSVYVVTSETKDGKSQMVAKKKAVKLLRTDGEAAVIDGLAPGDQIVKKGQSTLFDGAPVKIDDGKSAAETTTEKKQGE
ncbi:MAG: efflux RND transporter periplasmic adaptor subunit [Fimbriimonadaceae bacterium]